LEGQTPSDAVITAVIDNAVATELLADTVNETVVAVASQEGSIEWLGSEIRMLRERVEAQEATIASLTAVSVEAATVATEAAEAAQAAEAGAISSQANSEPEAETLEIVEPVEVMTDTSIETDNQSITRTEVSAVSVVAEPVAEAPVSRRAKRKYV